MAELKNTVPVKGDWLNQKTKLKAKFSTLTDADLQYETGKKDDMMKKVQTKLGKTKEELDTIIAGL
ncbi:MAG: general stress protein CsbD [Flavobacteriales bacterium]